MATKVRQEVPAEWSEVERLPVSFGKYEEELEQMPAGAQMKTGLIRLKFENINGKTHMTENFSSGPQLVQRVMYLDDNKGHATVLIQSIGGGILQGDRVRTEVEVCEGASVTLTTQAATKIYKMEKNYGTQRIDVKVAKDAYCEMLMEPLIPYKGVRLYSELNFEVHPSAVFLYSDQMSPGRTARGEFFAYDVLFNRMRATTPDGKLLAADTQVLEPKRTDPQGLAIYDGNSDMGTMFIFAQEFERNAEVATALHDSIQEIVGVFGSASVMPSGCGVHARVLGESNSRVLGAMHRCWERARSEVRDMGISNIYTVKHGFGPEIELATEEGE